MIALVYIYRSAENDSKYKFEYNTLFELQEHCMLTIVSSDLIDQVDAFNMSMTKCLVTTFKSKKQKPL
jgi:hypothetical protein